MTIIKFIHFYYQQIQLIKRQNKFFLMISSKQHSFQIIQSQQGLLQSRADQKIHFSAGQNQLAKSEFILIQQKGIIAQNLSRLKSLLSQKKQTTRRNKLQISPAKIFKSASPLTQKQNLATYTKYNTPNYSSQIRYVSKNDSQQVLSMDQNKNLISSIRQKINGASSRSKTKKSPFTKNIYHPEQVYFFQDKQIKKNAQIVNLVNQNVSLNSIVGDKSVEIKQKNYAIKQLQDRLKQVIHLNNRNQQKFHYVLMEKNQEINRHKAEKQSQNKIIHLKLENFMTQYENVCKAFVKNLNGKLARLDYKLQYLDKKQLRQAKTKIKLQKMIFQTEQPYRKSKNSIQRSPAIKGDSYQQLQKKRHQIQKQTIQKQIQFQKNKFEQNILYYQIRYEQLQKKLQQVQRQNQSMKEQLQELRQQNKLLNEYKQLNQRQKQLALSTKRPASFRKQVTSQSGLSSLNISPIIGKNTQTFSIASQAELDSKNKYKSYIGMCRQDRNEINDKQINAQTQKLIKQKEVSQERQMKQKQLSKQMQFEKQRQLAKQRQIALEKELAKQRQISKEKQIARQRQLAMQRQLAKQRQLARQRQLAKWRQIREIQLAKQRQIKQKLLARQRQIKQKQRIQSELRQKQQLQLQIQHVKSILRQLQENSSINKSTLQKQQNQNQSVLNNSFRSKTSKKLKQVVKIQSIAKKQKIQKQKIISKLQSLERQLNYQKQKNWHLQSLIDSNEKKMFQQVKKISCQNAFQTNFYGQQEECQSEIQQEEQPFSEKVQQLPKISKKKQNHSQGVQWQNKVRQRLQNAIQRLQILESKK